MPRTYVISDFNGEQVILKLQKTNKSNRVSEKVIKRKGDKVNGKWKIHDNSFNIWIDKKRYCYIK